MLKQSFTDGLRRKKKFVLQHQVGIQALLKILDNPNKTPDMNWLMLCIAAIGGPEHPIFQKGYKPEPKPQVIQPLFK